MSSDGAHPALFFPPDMENDNNALFLPKAPRYIFF